MGNNNIRTLRLTGKDILGYLPEVAKLRIAVFREYPYLYDGDFEYEKKYFGVVRPDDHPQKPQGYIPHDDFWRHRGYKPMIGMQCKFSWKEIGAIAEKEFPMSFWYKELPNE